VLLNSVQAKGPEGLELRVFDTSDLLDETVTSKDLLTAVEASLEMIKDGSPPAQVRFHEETGLLIIRGTQEQVSAVNQIVNQIHEKVERVQMSDRAAHSSMKVQQLESLVSKYKEDMTAAQTRFSLMEQELQRTREQLSVLEQENRQLRTDIQAAVAGKAKP
jgi:hypothetical protein